MESTRPVGLALDIDGLPEIYKMVEVYHPDRLSRCAAHPSSSLLPPKPQAWSRCHLFFLTTLPITMFFKVVFISFVVGAHSVNALTTPVARSLATEPECEFP